MKRLLLILTALCALCAARAQEHGRTNDKLIVGVEFETFFDNREYAGMGGFDESQTFFAAQLSPKIGWQWNDRNRIVFGAELEKNFGDHDRFFSETQPLMYYRFLSERVKAMAGVFERSEQRLDAYPLAMMSDEMRFYENRIHGLLGRYTSVRRPGSFVELSFDWCGLRGETSREKFRLMSAGRFAADWFRMGYAVSMFHFSVSDAGGGVSDNLMAYPYVGARFNAFLDFDIEFGAIVAPQRIREMKAGWKTPAGAQLTVGLSKWGVLLENTLYCGDGLMPYYGLYGSEFYAGERMWATTEGVYNRTRLGYRRSFFGDTMEVEAFVLVHYDGVAAGTSQQIKLRVDLEKVFGFGRKHRGR